MTRPVASVILTVLAVVAGCFAVLDVLRYLRLLPVAVVGEVSFYGFSLLGALLAGIVAVIWFWVAGRLWNLDPRGWLFVVCIAVIYLVLDFIAILAGTPFQVMLPSAVFSVVALIFALLPGTRRAYGQIGM